jgi:glycosyltransferase involved in cell wall biosynthesis
VTREPQVLVVGRFPPPLDGQAIATRRLARLLERNCDLRRINVSSGDSVLAESNVRLRSDRATHYLRARKRLKSAMKSTPNASILWTGISGSNLGHYRDLLITMPSLRNHERVFAVIHWGNFHELFERLTTKWTARQIVKRVSQFVFLNEGLRENCAKWIPDDKSTVIPNTIEHALWLSEDELTSKRMARQRRKRFRLLYLGSMTPSKGWADVVKAAQILTSTNIPVHLDIVGRWESEQDHASFSDFVLRHNLVGTVKHHGAISNRGDIKQLYGQADAFVLPTYYPTEAQPLTVIEAMNAGTPIITTRHAGLPEMIDEGKEGYFVPPRDPESIAAAILRLIPFEEWRSRSIAARNRFDEQFHPDLVREKWVALISS